VASRFDDELWELVPDPTAGAPSGGDLSTAAAPAWLAAFVAGLAPVARALDLGCGDGRLTASLRADAVVAADVSAVALERAGRQVPSASPAELTPDAPLPFEDGSFELVLCAETLEHVRDVQLLVSEVRRVLVPGGTFAVTTPAHSRLTGLSVLLRGFERSFEPLSPHLRFFTARSLRGLLAEMGFNVVSLRRERGTLLAVGRR
jgi:SAM-dependent methyltransferase